MVRLLRSTAGRPREVKEGAPLPDWEDAWYMSYKLALHEVIGASTEARQIVTFMSFGHEPMILVNAVQATDA